jgi:predicted DNA-binding WGR domain protein
LANTITTTRRFEFVGGGSDKFWVVTINGNEVTVHFGRNGTQGQTQKKSFPDSIAAIRHAETLVRAKIAKGYREVA